MNVLFLTMININSLYNHGLYCDLLRQFIKHGDFVYMVSAAEKGKQKEYVIEEPNAKIIKVPILSMQKTNILKKGLSMLTVDFAIKRGIKKYLSDVKFDIILYATPPITLVKSIEYVKKRDNAKTYLLLKDIFPQNAVDLGIMKKSGYKGIIYRYFRKKEQKIYKISDHIGCMSKANVQYILKNNRNLDPGKVEVCPNSVEIVDMSVSIEKRNMIREKYQLPTDKKIFVYGGNLGKPQGISFFIECIKAMYNFNEAFFLIVGDGTEFKKIESYINFSKQSNVRLFRRLPRDDYETLVGACDVGLIFLDHRFTIPNYPSRLLSYMKAKVPVFAITDPNTDIGQDIVKGNFGWWCESNNTKGFVEIIEKILQGDSRNPEIEYQYLIDNFNVEIAYKTICSHI